MGMPDLVRHWTAEMVRALPNDGKRYEVIDGELFVTPTPRLRHQEAVKALLLLLDAYVKATAVGHLLHSPADIELDPHTLVQPDLFVAPLVEGRRPRVWSEIEQLLLAVEVLSPSTARADRQVKRRRYLRHGVGEYWIVDLDARLIERWRPGDERPEIVESTLRWAPAPTASPFVLDLPAFFRDVLDG